MKLSQKRSIDNDADPWSYIPTIEFVVAVQCNDQGLDEGKAKKFSIHFFYIWMSSIQILPVTKSGHIKMCKKKFTGEIFCQTMFLITGIMSHFYDHDAR